MSDQDERWMALALSLGRRAMGRTWPNPAVGCVIVKNNRLIGRGVTGDGGRPHAETQALAMAGTAAQGADVYVTLEPCAHHGKTGPCAVALAEAGVKRVVSALQDPDPRVSGSGHQILHDFGIDIVTGCLSDQARHDHAGFLTRQTLKRPFVTLKLATSFDGRIATKNGESKWITGPSSRRLVHMMRSQHDAVLIGSGTALADDPSLTVRDLGVTKQPVRVVLDSQARLSLNSKLVATMEVAPLWICHGAEADPRRIERLTSAGATCIEVVSDASGVDISAALIALGDQGLTRVFCEGGGTLAASLVASDLVDELVGFSAGLVLGGDAFAAIAGLPFDVLADFPRFKLTASRIVGADVLHIWERG